jgi:Na+-transporting methylmalonyl-CoA/oxaloacetate decarboxylase gamma subunit
VDHPLVTALTITAIGMTLLFLALVFFYGLMSMMMSLLHRHQTGQDTVEAPASYASDAMAKQAAAIAVALARAEIEQDEASHGSSPRASVGAMLIPSQWWALHHQRRVTAASGLRRTR